MSHPRACPRCLRRSWLLALAAPYVEKNLTTAPGRRVFELLGLDDEALVEEVAPKVASTLLARVGALAERRFAEELAMAECWATCRHDTLYPEQLAELPAAPAALIGRGDPALLGGLGLGESAAIVGARRATSYGREVARGLGRDLAEAGVTVISGLAFGIDACAHRGALDVGTTIAVLGTGADIAYPAVHRSLWRLICEKGLVVSELPPGATPWRWTFPARNRIIAGLAGMTIVVEAAERSGSLIAAGCASRFERELGAVPGPITSRASAGANCLLSRGAHVVRGAEDVLFVLRGETGASPAEDSESKDS
jgi:DNA processing protein